MPSEYGFGMDISELEHKYFPAAIRTEIAKHIQQDESILFPCDCDCYSNEIHVTIYPLDLDTDVESLTFEFNYSLREDYLPIKLLDKYSQELKEADINIIGIILNIRQNCSSID